MGLCGGAALGIHIMDRLVFADVQLQIARRSVEILTGGRRDKEQRRIGLGRVIDQCAVRKLSTQRLRGGFCLFGILQERLGIDLPVRGKRQCAVIFQKHYAAAMGLGCGGTVGRISNHTLGGLRVTEGVLKHAKGKQLGQGAGHSAVQCLIGQHKLVLGKALRDRVGVVVVGMGAVVGLLPGVIVKQAADDVHAGVVDGKADALRHIEHFHAPRHIVGDAGVGVDIAGKAHLTAQHRVDKIAVVGEAIRLHLDNIALQVVLRFAFCGGRL